MGGLSGLLGGGGDLPDYKAYSTYSDVGQTVVDGDRVKTTLAAPYRELVGQVTGGLNLDPRMSQQAQELGAGALGKAGAFLSALDTDPFAMAEKQFGRMEDILAPGRERTRTALEEKLLRQGRLGSSGGALSQESLESAIEQSRRQSLYDAFQQAQGVQAQNAGLFQGLGAFGLGAEESGWQRQLQGLQGAMQLEQLPLAFADYSLGLSGQRSQHQQTQAQMRAAQNQALMGLVGGIGSGVLSGGLSFTPALMNTGTAAGFDPYSLAY